MRFTTDEHFLIGHDHVVGGKPCQDYALSGICDGAAFAIVSDGCSSGARTDVGARLVALSAAAAIRSGARPPAEVSGRQLVMFSEAKELLGLGRDDMLATCLYSRLSADGGYVYVRGDGVVAVRLRSGETMLVRFEWANNMPFYPAYADGGIESFIQAHGGDPSAIAFTEEWWCSDPKKLLRPVQLLHSVERGTNGVHLPIGANELPNIEYVAIFTDGVCRVDGMGWKDAAMELLAFKSTAGMFAKRRLMRFARDAQTKGRGPLDDIAYAVIRVDPEEPRADAESA